jgi:GGDEF domain-containing protein
VASRSIGVADYGVAPLPSVDELLAAADAAMYAAKRGAGRGPARLTPRAPQAGFGRCEHL